MPDSLTLVAMKTFALGKIAKWKDYVDLYFICKNYYSLKEIFKNEFIEKQFYTQLGYFSGIDYREEVTYISPNPLPMMK